MNGECKKKSKCNVRLQRLLNVHLSKGRYARHRGVTFVTGVLRAVRHGVCDARHTSFLARLQWRFTELLWRILMFYFAYDQFSLQF